jgi:hypothetical protein
MVVRKTGKNGKIEKTGKINKKTNKKPKSESNTQLFPPSKNKNTKRSLHTRSQPVSTKLHSDRNCSQLK